MDASYKIQRGIHVHLIQFFMCPEFWVHIILSICRAFRFHGDPHYHQTRTCGESSSPVRGCAEKGSGCPIQKSSFFIV